MWFLPRNNPAIYTWNTVKQAWKKLSNVALDSSSINFPPKSCIPSRAKMKMKRQSKTNKATMEAMESTKDFTRLPIADQYLDKRQIRLFSVFWSCNLFQLTLSLWILSEDGYTSAQIDQWEVWAHFSQEDTPRYCWWPRRSRTYWTETPCNLWNWGHTSSTTSRMWRGRQRQDLCTLGSHQATLADRGVQLQGPQCSGRQGSRSTRTWTETCKCTSLSSCSFCST